MDKISVIVPVYNSEKYLKKCLGSIIGQTYDNLEIIIVDDGSTDKSAFIYEGFAKRDNRIKIVQIAHSGVQSARKAGVEAATGKFVAFVDSDDWIAPDRIENLMEDRQGADIVIGNWSSESGGITPKPLLPGIYQGENGKREVCKVFFPAEMYEDTGMIVHWDKIYRTDLAKEGILPVPDSIWIGEDRCALLNMFLRADRISMSRDAGYYKCMPHTLGTVRKDILLNLHEVYTYMSSIIKGCPYENILKPGLDRYIMMYFRKLVPNFLDMELPEEFYYPYYGRLIGKKIILYGAGKVGQAYRRQILADKECSIVAWVDKNVHGRGGVILPDNIRNIKYDYIILAVGRKADAEEIEMELSDMGVPKEVILWSKTRQSGWWKK